MLGRPALIAPDGSLVRFRVKKHLALLIYLAVEPRAPQRREYIADLLWPNAPVGEGRHSLATAVSILRGMFGPGAVESTRDTIRLAFGGLATDLERLESGNVLGNELEPALEIGDLLQDLELPDAPGFCHWKDRLRAHWRPMIQTALLALLDRARRDGDWRQLDRLADRLFELEELSEQGMRAKMEAVALAGDRVAALKLYGQWSARLQEELSAVPSPLMQRFAEHLRRGGLAGGGSRPVASATAVRPFVGRADEYRALYEVWEATLERRPRHAILRGESGVGKTTLVARLLAAAALEGTAVARVRCYELEQEIPYAALTSLLAVLLDCPGAAATPPECLADLGLLLPAVRHRFPTLPTAVEAQGEGARLRFSEAAFQLITAVAEDQPVVLAVDDLHLADDVSLAVLHHVLRRLEGQRVMMVFAGRTADSSQSPNAARLIESAPHLGIRIINVEPLDEEASDQALGLMLTHGGVRPGTATRRALVRASHGYPMVLALLAHDWGVHRSASLALSLEAMTRDPASQGRSSSMAQDTYALLLDRVLQRLDSRTRPVLDLAAVLGSRMNELRFYELLGLSSAYTMGALSVLGDHHVMRSGGPGIEFVNDLVRVHLYLRIPATIRRQLHHLVAEELLQRSEDTEKVGGLELAWHLMRCGRVREAVACLLRGAREAIDHGAAWEAEQALCTAEPELTDEEVAEARLLLAEAIQEQGRFQESRQVILSINCREERTRLLATALELSGRRYLRPTTGPLAIEILEGLLGIAATPHAGRARAIAISSAAYFLRFAESEDLADAVVAVAREVESSELPAADEVKVTLARAMAEYHRRRLPESEEAIRSGLEKLLLAGITNTSLLECYNGLGAIACARGRYEEGEREFAAAHEVARRIGNATYAARSAANLGLCSVRLGRVAEGIHHMERALAAWEGGEWYWEAPVHLSFLATALAQGAQFQQTFETLAKLDRAIPDCAAPWMEQSCLLGKADALYLLGRSKEAESAARAALGNQFQSPRSTSRPGPYSRWLARLASKAQLEQAREAIDELLRRPGMLDMIDRAETLAARIQIEARIGDEVGLRAGATSSYQERLSATLASMPEGVTRYLERLGAFGRSKLRGASRRQRR
jgi:DNA-binding SARP family transcriptional activator/tetratricopeptide (TPR) repeat protein